MNVNRTWTLLIVAVAVIGGVYAITVWQRSRETRRLLDDLRSPDHAVAAEAMTSLRDRVRAVREQLMEMATPGQGPARWRSLTLLGEAGDAASRDALMAALQADDPAVQAAAATALAQRNVRGAADRIAMLASAEEAPMSVRVAAVRALQHLRTGTHLAEMSRLATDRPPPPPPEPEEGEEEAEPAEAGEVVEEWSDETVELRIEAVRAVAILGASAKADASGGRSPALNAADILAEASSPREHDDEVRQAACYALIDLAQMQMDDEVEASAIHALLRAAGDEVGDVRIAAIHGLKLIPTPAEQAEAVDRALEDALGDDHYWVRVAAGEEPIGG